MLVQWRHITDSLYCLDNLVILVQYDCMTAGVAEKLISLEQAQMLLLLVFAGIEIVCIERTDVCPAAPYEILQRVQSMLRSLRC